MSSRVIGNLSAEGGGEKIGKYYPFSDLFALSIYGPPTRLIGARDCAHNRLVPTRFPELAHRQHTLNLPLPRFGGNGFLKPGASPASVLVVKQYEGHVRSMFKRWFG